MKFNTLFVAAICAGSLFSSCVHKTAQENQLKYTHTSLVDGEGFAEIQTIGEVALDGVKYAEHAETTADAKSKEIAGKLKTFYNQFIPALDTLATALHMDFPIKGIPTGHDEEKVEATAVDTAATTAAHDHAAHADHAHAGHNHGDHGHDYTSHAQHELSVIKRQLTLMTRNTDKKVQDFAKSQLVLASELYTQIGGKEEAHGHH